MAKIWQKSNINIIRDKGEHLKQKKAKQIHNCSFLMNNLNTMILYNITLVAMINYFIYFNEHKQIDDNWHTHLFSVLTSDWLINNPLSQGLHLYESDTTDLNFTIVF